MSWEDSKYIKEQIISEARSVASTDDFKWGSDELKDLRQRWKDAGWAGPDDDSYLWDEFSGLMSEFHERRIADRDRRQAERDDGRRGKEQCISRARSLARSTDWKETAAELKELREEFYEYNAGRDNNQRLKQQFDAEVQVFFDNRTAHFERLEAERDRAASAKESLISEAKSLARSTDWKETHERITELRERFHKAGNAGKERNQELKEDLNDALQVFYDNRKAHFERMERERAEVLRAKESLISQAKSLSSSTNWKETHEALQELRERFGKAGHAGKDENNRLREEFNAACQTFYTNRTAYFQKRDAERKEVVRKKENIIARARALVNPSDTYKALEDMKDLRVEWQRAGRAGKEKDDELWEEFHRYETNLRHHHTAMLAAKRSQSTVDRNQRDLERTLGKALGKPDRSNWASVTETGRDIFGNAISVSTAGSDAYTHSTHEPFNGSGHTTGHASGDFHKHGSHSHKPKSGHFERGNPPPSGSIISEVVKKPK